MKLTSDLMEAFVRCRYKAFLKCTDKVGSITEYELLASKLADEYQPKAIQRLAERYSSREVAHGPLSLEDALKCRHRLILNVSSNDEHQTLTIPAVERLASGRQQDYAVLTFSPCNKATRPTKLIAALLGMALRTRSGLPISCAKVVFGDRISTKRLGLSGSNGPTTIGKEASSMLLDLESMVATPAAPKLFLNAHCSVCEFRDRCRTDALERENLSLLTGLQPKEIEAWNERGIFTVTQLAHTFRPKTMGRSSHNPKRHSQQLQAMAIRDKTTYIRKRPEMPAASIRVYLDVEGVPDTGLFYLIGIVVAKGAECTRHQFWADSEADQEAIWHAFLSALKTLDDYVLVHFGRYEKDFVREMIQRYGLDGGPSEAELLSRLFDVHGAIRTNVFFPVYSNGLKEIATHLGFHWQGPIRSGIDSIVWRYKWEEGKDALVKDALLQYNHEDCMAVTAVCGHLATLSQHNSNTPASCQDIDTLQIRHKGEFGNRLYALPALKKITKCAYFTYQQDKVFFRTDKHVRRSIARKNRTTRRRIKVNKVIECAAPTKCPRCGTQPMRFYDGSRHSKVITDAVLFRRGVKRWAVKYVTRRYKCGQCRYNCYSDQFPTKQQKCGHRLASLTVHQHIALGQSFDAVAENVSDLLGYRLNRGMVGLVQARMGQLYEKTETLLVARLRSGAVICGDEAKVKLRSGTGYVWVFSGPEVVVYRFSNSRDATVLNDIVKGFTGVLVSDFYSVYDSAPCLQQKCLVHLVRDINDDLVKCPFDGELKELASRFTALVTPVIETIDRYGLTQRHLRKFITDSERFRKWVVGRQWSSKVAQGYQRRIAKYGDRLFTFLSHDGVPWNNNLAENAVKLVASRRRVIEGLMSERGIGDYLIFLSIYQSLRRKGGNFLRFLLSGNTDLFEFLGE